MSLPDDNARPEFDAELVAIADYCCVTHIDSDEAYSTARYCLMDALGCGILALQEDPECGKHIGPIVPGASMDRGVPIPGTIYALEPVQAAFNIGSLVRWLDYNDTWLAAEWGHPSDNLGAILACADYANRHLAKNYRVHDVLTAMIKAYEIQGVLALENSFNQLGIDHVILVRIASTAVATQLRGGSRQQIINALSNAWLDGGALRSYRHAPNTGRRKSWAAGDASARGVRHALMAIQGEMGYPSALSAPHWGLNDVLLKQPLKISRPYQSYVMENVLFKVAYPAEFHAQTAVECAIELHSAVKDRLHEIKRIRLKTQSAAMRIINKSGPLHNPADRDHSLQYIVAIGLLFGELNSQHYSDACAADPRIDKLRALMQVEEDARYSRDYLDADKRAIANAISIEFSDGAEVSAEVEYPIGHRRRRAEAYPLLAEKLSHNLSHGLAEQNSQTLCALLDQPERLAAMRVEDFLGLWQGDGA